MPETYQDPSPYLRPENPARFAFRSSPSSRSDRLSPMPIGFARVSTQDRGFMAQMRGMVAGKSRGVYVATSWREANRLGEEGVIDMVVWDPEMEAGDGLGGDGRR